MCVFLLFDSLMFSFLTVGVQLRPRGARRTLYLDRISRLMLSGVCLGNRYVETAVCSCALADGGTAPRRRGKSGTGLGFSHRVPEPFSQGGEEFGDVFCSFMPRYCHLYFPSRFFPVMFWFSPEEVEVPGSGRFGGMGACLGVASFLTGADPLSVPV